MVFTVLYYLHSKYITFTYREWGFPKAFSAMYLTYHSYYPVVL